MLSNNTRSNITPSKNRHRFVFSYSFSNLITTFKNSLCLIVCLLALVLGTASAQPNSFAPGPAGDKDQQAGDKGAQGGFTPEQLAELQDAKNVWKSELAEENSEATNKLFVNTDSLYAVYNVTRKINFSEALHYQYKIYPCAILNKISVLDTALAACIFPVNKYYFKLIINPDKLTSTSQENLKLIDDIAASYKYKTVDVFNYLLPPLILQDNKKIKAADYEKMITQFFGSNPELIFYCSKKFINMIEKREFDKLMKLHRLSSNVIDMRYTDNDEDKNKSQK
jgi:hypothetical protein